MSALSKCGYFTLVYYLLVLSVWESTTTRSVNAQSQRQPNCRTIQAAFSIGEEGDTYFLSGNEYIKYNFRRETEETVGRLTELGLDEDVAGPSAAFVFNNGSLAILKGCQYFMYGQGGVGNLHFEGEGSDLGGLPCFPDAALRWEDELFVFKGCDILKYDNTTESFEPYQNLTERGLPCDLDSAVNWGYFDSPIFIKGNQFWEYMNGAIVGPRHTDELYLCSWYICGEADWMWERNRGRLSCNGDSRLCSLRLDQVTLAGLHNAGSGFHGGFSFFDCWVRNHARSVIDQLRLGIRHLDIDSSWETCGVLGSQHNIFCGGSICRIIKQLRTFLRESRHEVVTLNINHEMVDMEDVLPALTRQLQTQLGRMLNKRFRHPRGNNRWPTLRQSVRSNRRVFVFYTYYMDRTRVGRNLYRRNRWIHTERWLASTWSEFSITDNCSQIVNKTASSRWCSTSPHRELVEVSIIPAPTPGGICVDTIAERCRLYLHQSLRACEERRHSAGKSPNILLVDYPELGAGEMTSVFNATYHQNVRNILAHRHPACRVKIDAAVVRPGTDEDQVLFFVGSKIVIYSRSLRAQIGHQSHEFSGIQNAVLGNDTNIVLQKDCQEIRLNSTTLAPMTQQWTEGVLCFNGHSECNGLNPVDNNNPQLIENPLAECDIDAVLNLNEDIYFFRGNFYTTYPEPIRRGQVLDDWGIDAVQCGLS